MFGDMHAGSYGTDGKAPPRTTTLHLTPGEACLFAAQRQAGGLDGILAGRRTALDPSTSAVTLTDAEIGKLIRHCSYGSGLHPGLLRKIFVRALSQLLVG